MLPYVKLSQIYDGFWGKFSLDYIPFIRDITDSPGYNIDTILDLACGTGVLAIELSKEAKTVVGISLTDLLQFSYFQKLKNSNFPGNLKVPHPNNLEL